jgi:hypothetical protein
MVTGPHMNPSAYRYYFTVDGLKVNDPKNPMVADFRPTVDIVPKNETMFWQRKLFRMACCQLYIMNLRLQKQPGGCMFGRRQGIFPTARNFRSCI